MKILLMSISMCMLHNSYAQVNGASADDIQKIRSQEMKDSKVMEIAFRLTDITGPKLTASPGFMQAAQWRNRHWKVGNSQMFFLSHRDSLVRAGNRNTPI